MDSGRTMTTWLMVLFLPIVIATGLENDEFSSGLEGKFAHTKRLLCTEGGQCTGAADCPIGCDEPLVCKKCPQGDCPSESPFGTCLPNSEAPNCTDSCNRRKLLAVPLTHSCKVTGCNGEICSDEPASSICVYKKEYICYKFADCGPHGQGGECGWHQTPVLKACLDGFAD